MTGLELIAIFGGMAAVAAQLDTIVDTDLPPKKRTGMYEQIKYNL